MRVRVDPDEKAAAIARGGSERRGLGEALGHALVEVFGARARVLEDALGDETGVLADRRLDPVRDVGVLAQEALGVLASLAEALAVEGEPGARLLDHAGLHPEVDELADLGDALAEHDVELDLLEWRRDLVLHHLDPDLVADRLVALLER